MIPTNQLTLTDVADQVTVAFAAPDPFNVAQYRLDIIAARNRQNELDRLRQAVVNGPEIEKVLRGAV